MSKHLAALALICLAAAILYARVSGAYFCGYDDFAEIHRANFEDTAHPMEMLTTTHFGTPKYRPLARLESYAMWRLGRGGPLVFRIKNLVFHLAAAAMVYGIAWLMFGSQAMALGAGLLFALHPVANQPVVAASWALTTGYALLLASFFFFLYSLHTKHNWGRPLAVSLGILWVDLFLYEAVIVGFAFIFGYLFLWWKRGRLIHPRYVYSLIGGTTVVLGSFFAVRHLFVSQPLSVTPATVIARNVVMYMTALLLPVDSVWANAVFGTPLPSELKLTVRFAATVLAVVLLLAAIVAWAARRPSMRARLKALDWPELVFLAAAALFALAPFLAFSGHPSETYLYLPVALYAILLSRFLFQIAGSKAAYAAAVSVLLVSFTAGTWVKNERVVACGATVEKILSELPVSQWQHGSWHLRLASNPDDPPVRHYGIYGYHGLATIELTESGIRAMEMALQVASGNPQVKADVVDAKEMTQCTQPGTCYWVSAQGDVKEAAARASQ